MLGTVNDSLKDLCEVITDDVGVFLQSLLLFPLWLVFLLPRIDEGSRDDEIFTHTFGQDETNVGYKALLSIGAKILYIALAGMVGVLDFLKAISVDHF